MTTRQMLSMVFSTIYFGHSMDTTSYLAVILVFGTVFYSVRRRKDSPHKPKPVAAAGEKAGIELAASSPSTTKP